MTTLDLLVTAPNSGRVGLCKWRVKAGVLANSKINLAKAFPETGVTYYLKAQIWNGTSGTRVVEAKLSRS